MHFNSIDMEEIVPRVSRIIKKIYSMGGLYPSLTSQKNLNFSKKIIIE